MVACLSVAEIAEGFFSRGTIDAGLGYSSLEIYKDQEDYWGGTSFYPSRRAAGRHGYRYPVGRYGFISQDEYYLTGLLENLSNRTRRGLRVVFYASDCVRERTHWTVTVGVDSLGPHQSLPIREFISYSEPTFPCRFRFHVTEEADSPPSPEITRPFSLPPPDPAPENPEPTATPAQEPLAPDNAPIYRWVDENGVVHYSNRPFRSDDRQWKPAWEEE